MGIWLLLDADRNVAEQVIADSNPTLPGADGAAPSYEWPRNRVVEAPRAGDLAIERWFRKAWHPRLDRLEEELIGQIDAHRAKLLELPADRTYAYLRKGIEAEQFKALPADEPRANMATRFPWLWNEATMTARSIDQVADSVIEAQRLSDERAIRIEAAAVLAKRRVREAQTAELKRAAAASMNGID